MASSSSSLPASSSSSSSSASFSYNQWKYHVFLSFYGQDTRKSFTDHLFVALLDKGIHTFKVEPGLERGKPIEDILKAIQESRFSIVIFSANFAFSTWCLEELATIVECVEEGRQKVFPIFYHVDPSEVQQVTGRYEEAFRGHEEGFRNDINKVSGWRDAMKRVANVSGWHLKNKRESKFIQGIVKEIKNQLSWTQRINIDLKDLVGIESRVMDISAYLAIQPSDDDAIRTIGIFGMGGIGKSTIGRVVYMNFAHQFQASSFIENIGVVERNLRTVAHLQEQLLCDILKERDQSVRTTYEREKGIRTRLRRKRALIVLDDVTHLKQLELLAGDRYWFGSGSRIIITTRDEHLLDCYGMDKEYKVEVLNHYEALELFCKKAFPNGSHSEDHEELCHQFVEYANCLPLALTVLGPSMCGRPINVRKETLDKLQKFPNKEILENLEIGFHELDRNEKSMFLDIACFFVGKRIENVLEVLRSCGFYLNSGINILVDKNLVTISKGILWMHHLLQEMGQEIIRRQSYVDAGKRIRLWQYEEICDVVSNNTATERVEAIVLDGGKQGQVPRHLSGNGLSKVRNLRLLKFKNIHLSEGIQYVLKIRYFEWHEYPCRSLPSTFQPNKLVSLHLPHSNMVQLWKGTKYLEKLEVLNVSHSQSLIRTPDFNGLPKLKNLNLEGCCRLMEIQESIGVLRTLEVLNLKDCASLTMLPDSICDLKSLEILNLLCCSKLKKLPERLGDLTHLQVLKAGRISKGQTPSSANNKCDFLLPCLLILFWTMNIFRWVIKKSTGAPWSWWLLPWRNPNPRDLRVPTLSTLCCLRQLILWECILIDVEIPDHLGCLPMLEMLSLSSSKMISLPPSTNQLSRLQFLSCLRCSELQSSPHLPLSIKVLSFAGCISMETLPINLCQLPDLRLVVLTILTVIVRDNIVILQYVLDLPSMVTVRINGWVPIENHMPEESQAVFPLPLNLLCIVYLGIVYPNCSLSVSFSGSKIPRWFNFQAPASTFNVVHLPSGWRTAKWLGFCICVAFQIDKKYSPVPESFNFMYSLYICSPLRTNFCWSRNTSEVHFPDQSDSDHQLSFIFIPIPNIDPDDFLSDFEHFYLNLSHANGNGVAVKSWGFRIVFQEDAEEILKYQGFPAHKDNLQDNGGSHGECWCDHTSLDPCGTFFRFALDEPFDDPFSDLHLDEPMEQ